MKNQHLEYLLEKESALENELKVVKHWIFEERSKMGSVQEVKDAITPIIIENQDNKTLGYEKMTWNEKFLSVLKENQRFMKVRGIAEVLVAKLGGDASEITTQLSRRTKKLKDLGKITKFKASPSNMDVYWGSPNWLEANGDIKKGYEYKEDTISSNRSSIQSFDL